MAKHILWATVVLIVATFAAILLSTPEQADLIKDIIGGLMGVSIFVAFLLFLWKGMTD